MGIVHVLNGRLRDALKKVWPPTHHGPDDAREIISVAEALREKGEPLDRHEVQLLNLADRLQLMTRSEPRPRPPSPFDERIAETAEQLAEVTAELEAANVELVQSGAAAREAGDRLSRALGRKDAQAIASTEGELHVALDRRAQAEYEHHRCDAAWLRVKARMTSLEMLRSRWHAEATATVLGPGGVTMTLREYSEARPRGETVVDSRVLADLGRQAPSRR